MSFEMLANGIISISRDFKVALQLAIKIFEDNTTWQWRHSAFSLICSHRCGAGCRRHGTRPGHDHHDHQDHHHHHEYLDISLRIAVVQDEGVMELGQVVFHVDHHHEPWKFSSLIYQCLATFESHLSGIRCRGQRGRVDLKHTLKTFSIGCERLFEYLAELSSGGWEMLLR